MTRLQLCMVSAQYTDIKEAFKDGALHISTQPIQCIGRTHLLSLLACTQAVNTCITHDIDATVPWVKYGNEFMLLSDLADNVSNTEHLPPWEYFGSLRSLVQTLTEEK